MNNNCAANRGRPILYLFHCWADAFLSYGGEQQKAEFGKRKRNRYTGARSPVEDRRPGRVDFTPGEKIRAHDVFQMRAGGDVQLREMQRESRIAPVEFGRFDEALAAIHGVRLEAYELV